MEQMPTPPPADIEPLHEEAGAVDGGSPEDSPDNDVESSINDIHKHASELGLPDEFTDEAISAFSAVGSPENIASGLQRLDARLANMQEITKDIGASLEAAGELLNTFIKELIEMIETIDRYMNEILHAKDEAEKTQLVHDLQQEINRFGANY